VHRMLRDLHSFPTRRSSDLKSGAYVCVCPLFYTGDAHTGQYRVQRSADRTLTGNRAGTMDETVCISPVNLLIYIEIYGGIRQERSEEHTSELQSRFDLVCRL